DRFLLSFELGVMKHDSAFFDAVLASSGRPPEDFVLIDDKPVNCRSANSRGIDAILFQSWHATLQRLGLEKDGVR
ncbi:MAG: HAD-IA family hydrolase, partial [Gammaproteobacteria bacterium]